MEDKDGKKLQTGSLVSAKKPGRSRFTLRGTVVSSDEAGNIVIFDANKEHNRTYRASDIKRIRYRP